MWTRILGELLVAGCAVAQTPAPAQEQAPSGQASAAPSTASPAAPAVAARPGEAPRIIIPSGTKVPLALKQAISTRNAQEGDPVYCETTFPFVIDDRIVIPAGTYIQGKSSRVQRPGRIKGRAELLMHFTSMIYPNG